MSNTTSIADDMLELSFETFEHSRQQWAFASAMSANAGHLRKHSSNTAKLRHEETLGDLRSSDENPSNNPENNTSASSNTTTQSSKSILLANVPYPTDMADTEQALSKDSSAPKSTRIGTPASSGQQKGAQNPQKTPSAKLEDQAATAALYVTKNQRKSDSPETWLDSNNKLSSAGAAASLKYATAKDLPSFPSSGLPPNASAAGAAASLGWANQKPFEHWKPDPSSAASTAAMLAKDYKMDPLWQPQQSTNGAKAALLAHRDSKGVEIWKPEASSWSNSAALLAVQAQKKGSPVLQVDNKNSGKGSLLAATGAMAGSRRRAESTPQVPADTYPDQSNAVANALNAATAAHKPSVGTRHPTAGTSTAVTNMSREMYTSNPPVGPEQEERERAGVLRASAVAMAQKMYTIQQEKIDAAAQEQAASSAYGRESVSSPSDEAASPMRFGNLHEAAQKLAQKRLSMLHDEHVQAREYRDYYGDSKTKPSVLSKRLSMAMPSGRGRTRMRSSSEGGDEQDAERIRAQMSSLFSSNLSKVTAKKRQEDREALIAIAQRNVAKSLHGMDERVFQDTGKVNPSLRNEWEVKAQAAAQAKSDVRMQNHGKINIGGGKFVNQSAVDLAAARNVQPALDEINENAAAEHARQAEVKADQEDKKRTEESTKLREKEDKELQKKLKQEDKEKAKAAKEEEKRLAKDEKRKSKGRFFSSPKSQTEKPIVATTAATEPAVTEPTVAAAVPIVAASEPAVVATEPDVIATEPIVRASEPVIEEPIEQRNTSRLALDAEEVQPSAAATTPSQEVTTPAVKTSPESASPKNGGRVKSWLKNAFSPVPHSNSRRMSRSQKSEPGAFVGGVALTDGPAETSASGALEADNYGSSVTGVEASTAKEISKVEEPVATRAAEPHSISGTGAGAAAIGGIFSKRDEKSGDDFEEARDNFDQELAPPAIVIGDLDRTGASSPVRETKFREEIS